MKCTCALVATVATMIAQLCVLMGIERHMVHLQLKSSTLMTEHERGSRGIDWSTIYLYCRN